MQPLELIALLVGILAAAVTIVAGIIPVSKWLVTRLHAPQPQVTSPTPQYDYCLTYCMKNRWSIYGYFVAVGPDDQPLPFRERYNALLDVSFSWNVEPSRLIKQHVEAFDRLFAQLKAAGWEYVDHPDVTIWYLHRFRRRKDT